MKLDRYCVYKWGNKNTGEISRFAVGIDSTNVESTPVVADFPVTGKFSAAQQRHHATLFCEYMNKIQEATEKAYEQNMLVDILKQ